MPTSELRKLTSEKRTVCKGCVRQLFACRSGSSRSAVSGGDPRASEEAKREQKGGDREDLAPLVIVLLSVLIVLVVLFVGPIRECYVGYSNP